MPCRRGGGALPPDEVLLRGNFADADEVFDQHGDRPERGPAAEVGTADSSLAVEGGFGQIRLVAFPNGVGGVSAPGFDHVGEQFLRQAARLVVVAVVSECCRGDVGQRHPDSAPPVGASRREGRIVAAHGRAGTGSAKLLRICQMSDDLPRLFRGGHVCGQRPEDRRGEHPAEGAVPAVLKGAGLRIPVALKKFRFLLEFPLKFPLQWFVADESGEFGDRAGGKSLLGDGVEPEETVPVVAAARGVVHAGGVAVPAVSFRSFPPGERNGSPGGIGGVVGTVFQKFVVTLQRASLFQKAVNPGGVAGEAEVFELRPGWQRRIVRVLDLQSGGGPRHDRIEIVETLDAREGVRGVAAEETHERGVPDPHP